jgi:hypothetical protein
VNLFDELRTLFLSPTVFKLIMETVRAELAPKCRADPRTIETELRRLRLEQMNLSQAIAAGGVEPDRARELYRTLFPGRPVLQAGGRGSPDRLGCIWSRPPRPFHYD